MLVDPKVTDEEFFNTYIEMAEQDDETIALTKEEIEQITALGFLITKLRPAVDEMFRQFISDMHHAHDVSKKLH